MKINDIEDLKKAFDIKNIKMKDNKEFNFEGMISDICNAAVDIWKGEKLYNFTNHGLEHSFSVAEKGLEITQKVIEKDENFRLNPLEKFVFASSTLIHDIGMQYHKYFELKENGEYENLSPAEIRNNHAKLGKKIVMNSIDRDFFNKKIKTKIEIPSFCSPESYYLELLRRISFIAFYHSDNSNLIEDLRNNPNHFDDFMYTELDMTIRIKMLIGLLRIADELDCDCNRVPDVKILKNNKILSKIERAHWLSHFFIKTVEIYSPGFGSARFNIRWRVPQLSLDGNEEFLKKEERIESIIRDLIDNYRIEKIKIECKNIEKLILNEERVFTYNVNFIQTPDKEILPNFNFDEDFDKEILKDIENENPYKYKIKHFETPSNLNKISSINMNKELTEIEIIAKNFLKNIPEKHWSLKTGYHTNKYIQCRDLIINRLFLLKLIEILFEFFKEDPPTLIISIGTSSIPIGTLLSNMFKIKYTFTFSGLKLGYESYTKFEKLLNINENEKILIIDDIIGVGTVVNLINNKLISKKPKYIKYFFIYSLGDIKDEIKKINNDIKMYFLVEDPDIKYWKEKNDNKCEYCRENPNILTENEL